MRMRISSQERELIVRVILEQKGWGGSPDKRRKLLDRWLEGYPPDKIPSLTGTLELRDPLSSAHEVIDEFHIAIESPGINALITVLNSLPNPKDYRDVSLLAHISCRETFVLLIKDKSPEEVSVAIKAYMSVLPLNAPKNVSDPHVLVEWVIDREGVRACLAIEKFLSTLGLTIESGTTSGIVFDRYLAWKNSSRNEIDLERPKAHLAGERDNNGAQDAASAVVVVIQPVDEVSMNRLTVTVYGFVAGRLVPHLTRVGSSDGLDSAGVDLLSVKTWLSERLESLLDRVDNGLIEARVEFFLPFPLMDEPVDEWKMGYFGDSEPIGTVRHVVVRSLALALKGDPPPKMKRHFYSQCRGHHKISPGINPYTILALSPDGDSAFVCSHAMADRGSNFWRGVAMAGIPYGIWARAPVDTDPTEVYDALASFVKPEPLEFPKRVWEHRVRVTDADTSATQIGTGLGLLYESKDIWPPIGNEDRAANTF
jgi:hypothetical protein